MRARVLTLLAALAEGVALGLGIVVAIELVRWLAA